MKKLVLLATAALVAMLILVPAGATQEAKEATTAEPLPETGGLVAPSVLLPAAALLLGSSVVTYALVRRR